MTANWPIPAVVAGSRRIAARLTLGDLFEQLQPFAAQIVFEHAEAGRVAARAREALDEPGTDRVGKHRKYDRHGTRCLQQRSHARRARSEDHVGRKRDQFCRVSAYLGGIACRPAGVNAHIAALCPAQLLQPLNECSVALVGKLIVDREITPIRRMRSGCCARTESGHAAAPPSSDMNARRLTWTNCICCRWPGTPGQHNPFRHGQSGRVVPDIAGAHPGYGFWIHCAVSGAARPLLRKFRRRRPCP
jgi:hypothetical protein